MMMPGSDLQLENVMFPIVASHLRGIPADEYPVDPVNPSALLTVHVTGTREIYVVAPGRSDSDRVGEILQPLVPQRVRDALVPGGEYLLRLPSVGSPVIVLNLEDDGPDPSPDATQQLLGVLIEPMETMLAELHSALATVPPRPMLAAQIRAAAWKDATEVIGEGHDSPEPGEVLMRVGDDERAPWFALFLRRIVRVPMPVAATHPYYGLVQEIIQAGIDRIARKIVASVFKQAGKACNQPAPAIRKKLVLRRKMERLVRESAAFMNMASRGPFVEKGSYPGAEFYSVLPVFTDGENNGPVDIDAIRRLTDRLLGEPIPSMVVFFDPLEDVDSQD